MWMDGYIYSHSIQDIRHKAVIGREGLQHFLVGRQVHQYGQGMLSDFLGLILATAQVRGFSYEEPTG